tara:strand:+ start:82 stop:393 length:312 start_codon:yes stop_codon:yes gene_type:complete
MQVIVRGTIYGGIEFHRIDNDINGNGRLVIHYLSLVPDWRELEGDTSDIYEQALTRAKAIGGKKYRAKWFGGGIVFQSSSARNLYHDIKYILNKEGVKCANQE